MSSIYADLGVKYYYALEALDALTEKNQLLQDVTSELKRKLDQIAQNWESTGVDREEYYTELTRQVEKIRGLSRLLVSLRNTVLNYLESIKETSSNSL